MMNFKYSIPSGIAYDKLSSEYLARKHAEILGRKLDLLRELGSSYWEKSLRRTRASRSNQCLWTNTRTRFRVKWELIISFKHPALWQLILFSFASDMWWVIWRWTSRALENISRSKQYQHFYLLLCFSLAASFLIPYLICLVFCGIPIFYLEVALGQYVQQGVVGAWAAYCPALGGEIAIQSAQFRRLKWNFEVLFKIQENHEIQNYTSQRWQAG